MALEKEHIPTELFDAYKEGKCGVFVGAGLSRGAGLPDWGGLLHSLIDKAAADNSIPEDKAGDCRSLADDPSKFLMLAQEMKEVLGVEFKSVIEDIFGRADLKPTPAHELLVSLAGNKFIITTNYDMLIEQAFAAQGQYRQGYKYYEAHALLRDLYKRSFFILKAHGDAKTAPEHIILTDKDYRRLLYKEPGYQSALQSIFTMYSVIFLGSSLQDPELRLLLNYINAAFPEGGIPHYALMTTDQIGDTERGRWKKDYNMRIIPISSDKDYEDINRFLRFLDEVDAKDQ